MGYRIKLMLAMLPLLGACGESTPESQSTASVDPAVALQASLTGLEAGELPELP